MLFLGSCIITEIEKMEGEASANNRKAKLIFFFEWSLHLKWAVSIKDSDISFFWVKSLPSYAG